MRSKVLRTLSGMIALVLIVRFHSSCFQIEERTAVLSPSTVTTLTKKVHGMVCKDGDILKRPEWEDLCAGGFVEKVVGKLLEGPSNFWSGKINFFLLIF